MVLRLKSGRFVFYTIAREDFEQFAHALFKIVSGENPFETLTDAQMADMEERDPMSSIPLPGEGDSQ